MNMLEHDPEKWEPVFGKRSCSNKEVERDDDSKKNHPALTHRRPMPRCCRRIALQRANSSDVVGGGRWRRGGDPQNPALSCGEGLASALLGLLGGDLSFIPERAAYWGNSL